MFELQRGRPWTIVLALTLATAARSAPPQEEAIPVSAARTRAVRHGEALPPGVLARLAPGPIAFLSVAFSPDSSLLASGGYDRTIYLWDTATGKLLRKWDAPEGNLAAL